MEKKQYVPNFEEYNLLKEGKEPMGEENQDESKKDSNDKDEPKGKKEGEEKDEPKGGEKCNENRVPTFEEFVILNK